MVRFVMELSDEYVNNISSESAMKEMFEREDVKPSVVLAELVAFLCLKNKIDKDGTSEFVFNEDAINKIENDERRESVLDFFNSQVRDMSVLGVMMNLFDKENENVESK